MDDHQEILDPTFDQAQWLPARRRRMVLVAYLDLLILSLPGGAIEQAVRHFLTGTSMPLWLELLAYAIVELILLRFISWSPGCSLLGVRLVEARTYGSGADRIWKGRLPFVSRELKSRESWLTLALGTLILNGAMKSLIRWAMWNPPMPMFGHPTDELTGAIVWIASGAIETAVAIALFRVDVRGVIIGIPYHAAHLVSAVAGWRLWGAWAEEMVVRRRAYQGLPVRAGEIEMVRAIAAVLTVGTLVVMIALLLAVLPRLRRRAASQRS